MTQNLAPQRAHRQTRDAASAIPIGRAVKVDANGGWALAGDGDPHPLCIMEPDYAFGKDQDNGSIAQNERGTGAYLGIGEPGRVSIAPATELTSGTALCHAADGQLDAGTAGDTVVAILDEPHAAGEAGALRNVVGAGGVK